VFWQTRDSPAHAEDAEDDYSAATRRCATAASDRDCRRRSARDLALRHPSSRPPASAVTPFSLPKSIPVRGDPNTSHPHQSVATSRIPSLHCADFGSLHALFNRPPLASARSHRVPWPERHRSPVAARTERAGHVVQPAVHLHLLQGSRTLCPALSRPDALVGCNRRQLRPASKWG
jgi:hypothetical protein